MYNTETFPDGTPIDDWFYRTDVPKLKDLGKQYILTDHNICDDGRIYTKEIQKLIDTAAASGGGVIVVPCGTYLTGALFFRQGVHLYISEGGILKGSDDISDYPIKETRMEGETCPYFTALINAENIDGFIMCGNGTIDGNGKKRGRHFGSDVSGTRTVQIRTNSVQDLFTYLIAVMLLFQVCICKIRIIGQHIFIKVII